MAVPMSVISTRWSCRPTAAGQSRWRTSICMSAITTPSAPSPATSCSSRRRASCRAWFTSSLQAAISALPDHWRACRVVARSSCRDPIAMPSASPAGTQPALISLAKSCPDRSEVKGTRGPVTSPAARTAVPMAANWSPPSGNDPRDSRTPTTPWPPTAAHWAIIRSMAACRAWYLASTCGPNDPGQLARLAGLAAKTAAPNTWPTGAKPALAMAANS